MRRWLLGLFVGIVAAPFIYFLAGFVGAVIPGKHAQIDGLRTERIGLVRGPIHYDFLLPLSHEILDDFAFAGEHGVPIHHPNARWLVAGWGAEAFYTTVGTYSDLTASAIWRGISGDQAVLHLDAIGPVADFDGLTWVNVSPAQLDALASAIAADVSRDADGQPTVYPLASYGPTDVFFAAASHFDLRRTCNVWVGEIIRAAGLRFGAWTPTPQAVELSLAWFAE